MRVKGPVVFTGVLVGFTFLSGALLASSFSFADDSAVDNIAVSVPVSCSMEGTGMNSHNASIVNGTYQADIGSTTLRALCNDFEGFAIYAIGFTNEEYGNTNLIGNNMGQSIVTGTATSASNPDTSNWAVKLTTDDSATFPLSLDNGFDLYNSVPATYTKVAHRDSATDIGTSAIGSELTTTYAAYIAKDQIADSYTGMVKYTLVHPASKPTPKPQETRELEVTYDSGNLYFDTEGTKNKNTVTYSITCGVETKHVDIYKTSNINDAGIQNDAYEDTRISKVLHYPNASKVKVVVNYGFTADTGAVEIHGENEQYYEIYSEDNNISGTETYVLNGDKISIGIWAWETENLVAGYDYGAYITIYPLDENGNEISFSSYSDCEWGTIDGEYLEPHLVSPYNFGGWMYEGTGYYLEWELLEQLMERCYEDSITLKAQYWL